MEVDKRSRLLHEVLMGIELQLKHPGADIPELTKRKLGILLELRQYQGVLHEGLCFVGSEGPDPLVFKHIVSALCHTAKYQESLEILERWSKTFPDQKSSLQEIRQILEPLIKRAISGPVPFSMFQNLDHLLGLQKIGVPENGGWRYRSPPAQCVTYYICPRITELVPCMFGDKCLAAHSKEELEEWKARAKSAASRMNCLKPTTVLGVSPPQVQPSPQLGATLGASGARLPPPPSNTPYLNQLIENYSEYSPHLDFWPAVEGVKLTWSSPLQLRTTNLDHIWIVLIRSQRKDTLRTISLLHNIYRANFRISEAYFCEDSSYRQCMDLVEANICNHKNASKLQVLSTFIPPKCLNRPCYYYRIGFAFQSTGPGDFAQTIVFDFKENPKLVQHLTVQVLKYDGAQPNGQVGTPTTPAIAQTEPSNTHRLPNSGTGTGNAVTVGNVGIKPLANHQRPPLQQSASPRPTPTILQNHFINNPRSESVAIRREPHTIQNGLNVSAPLANPSPHNGPEPAAQRGSDKLPERKYVPPTGSLYTAIHEPMNQFQPPHHAGPNVFGIDSIRGNGRQKMQGSSCFSNSSSGSDSPVSFDEEITGRRPIPTPISRPTPKSQSKSYLLGKILASNPEGSIQHSWVNGGQGHGPTSQVTVSPCPSSIDRREPVSHRRRPVAKFSGAMPNTSNVPSGGFPLGPASRGKQLEPQHRGHSGSGTQQAMPSSHNKSREDAGHGLKRNPDQENPPVGILPPNPGSALPRREDHKWSANPFEGSHELLEHLIQGIIDSFAPSRFFLGRTTTGSVTVDGHGQRSSGGSAKPGMESRSRDGNSNPQPQSQHAALNVGNFPPLPNSNNGACAATNTAHSQRSGDGGSVPTGAQHRQRRRRRGAPGGQSASESSQGPSPIPHSLPAGGMDRDLKPLLMDSVLFRELCNMGFSEHEVVRALQRTDLDAEKAVDILLRIPSVHTQ